MGGRGNANFPRSMRSNFAVVVARAIISTGETKSVDLTENKAWCFLIGAYDVPLFAVCREFFYKNRSFTRAIGNEREIFDENCKLIFRFASGTIVVGFLSFIYIVASKVSWYRVTCTIKRTMTLGYVSLSFLVEFSVSRCNVPDQSVQHKHAFGQSNVSTRQWIKSQCVKKR